MDDPFELTIGEVARRADVLGRLAFVDVEPAPDAADVVRVIHVAGGSCRRST